MSDKNWVEHCREMEAMWAELAEAIEIVEDPDVQGDPKPLYVIARNLSPSDRSRKITLSVLERMQRWLPKARA